MNNTKSKTILEILAAKKNAAAKILEEAEQLQQRWDSLVNEVRADLLNDLLQEAKTNHGLMEILRQKMEHQVNVVKAKDKQAACQFVLSELKG